MAPSLGIPAGLPHLVHDAFLRAKAAGDLSFFPTQVALLRVHGVPVRPPLRIASSLPAFERLLASCTCSSSSVLRPLWPKSPSRAVTRPTRARPSLLTLLPIHRRDC